MITYIANSVCFGPLDYLWYRVKDGISKKKITDINNCHKFWICFWLAGHKFGADRHMWGCSFLFDFCVSIWGGSIPILFWGLAGNTFFCHVSPSTFLWDTISNHVVLYCQYIVNKLDPYLTFIYFRNINIYWMTEPKI